MNKLLVNNNIKSLVFQAHNAAIDYANGLMSFTDMVKHIEHISLIDDYREMIEKIQKVESALEEIEKFSGIHLTDMQEKLGLANPYYVLQKEIEALHEEFRL